MNFDKWNGVVDFLHSTVVVAVTENGNERSAIQ